MAAGAPYARGRRHRLADLVAGALIGVAACSSPALAAAGAAPESHYPFEGTWVRADRVCTASAPHARTYTAREVASAGGRCTIHKVVPAGGQTFELVEDCRKTDRTGSSVETLRMLGPDSMLVKIQVRRLKIPRGRRYTRCTPAAAGQRPVGLGR